MNCIECKNLQVIPLKEIPELSLDGFREEVLQHYTKGRRIVQFFARQEEKEVILYAVFAEDDSSSLFIFSTRGKSKFSYPSFTPEIPSIAFFEREVFEQCGITPQGHPWLKPVRNSVFRSADEKPRYSFFTVEGEEIHEVGVGPIHAGIIEPGHFRFSCHGEKVYHLEIQLGYQHRGIEQLFQKHAQQRMYMEKLAESIAGDTVIGHGGTFIRALEALADLEVSKRAKMIRTIALELERIAVHLGDLSALAGDVAYLTGQSVFGALRTKIINTTLAICGNRFGRGLLTTGGVWFDIPHSLQEEMLTLLTEVEEMTELAAETMFSSASVLERFENTGIVSKELARELGLVGIAARASGLARDVRVDHPAEAYEFIPVHKLTMDSGDVFSRAYMRYVEIQQSMKIIRELLTTLVEGPIRVEPRSLQPHSCVLSLTEGWRGEIAHVCFTNAHGELQLVKIKDPSFHNWQALAMAMRGEEISNFPLCNKSFNLSYCGFDL